MFIKMTLRDSGVSGKARLYQHLMPFRIAQHTCKQGPRFRWWGPAEHILLPTKFFVLFWFGENLEKAAPLCSSWCNCTLLGRAGNTDLDFFSPPVRVTTVMGPLLGVLEKNQEFWLGQLFWISLEAEPQTTSFYVPQKDCLLKVPHTAVPVCLMSVSVTQTHTGYPA